MKAKLILLAAASIMLAYSGQAQVLNRLKNKVENKGEQKAGDAIDNLFNGKKKNQNAATTGANGSNGQNGSSSGNGSNGSGSNNNPSNNGGGGLVSTPPDVK